MVRKLVGKAHFVELADRAWRQSVAAGLDPREMLLFDDDDIVAGFCEPKGRR